VNALTAVAAYGLPGAPAVPPAVGDGEWRALLEGACDQRVTGHLVQAVVDGALAVDDAQWDAALEEHRSALALALVLDGGSPARVGSSPPPASTTGR
jgi:hypothetical protein